MFKAYLQPATHRFKHRFLCSSRHAHPAAWKHRVDGFNRARGLKIIDHSLLYEALTHHSYVNDIASKSTQIPFSNRRLEFLGDSVIDVIVSSTLFGRENSTQYKHAIVSNDAFAKVFLELFEDDVRRGLILLDKSGSTNLLHSPQRKQKTVLASVLESLVGAIFVDQGFSKAEQWFLRNVFPALEANGLESTSCSVLDSGLTNLAKLNNLIYGSKLSATVFWVYNSDKVDLDIYQCEVYILLQERAGASCSRHNNFFSFSQFKAYVDFNLSPNDQRNLELLGIGESKVDRQKATSIAAGEALPALQKRISAM
jgi:dsRNA-specific ribonuclease